MKDLAAISRALSRSVSKIEFTDPVAYVYNPLRYAERSHALYLERFGRGTKEVVLLGMNPGPFGMAQTGVPFGDVGFVRDWMGIVAPVGAPSPQHPKRPVLGFECTRSEVSGSRIWGWAKERFGTPERFFERFFVLNYCPLVFLEKTGRNLTPNKLKKAERAELLPACDIALRNAIALLEPRCVVGVGTWAAQRAASALGRSGPPVGSMLHPSPASPKANRGWAAQAENDLLALGIKL